MIHRIVTYPIYYIFHYRVQINDFNSHILCFQVEMKEQLEVTDLKGNKIGVMNVSLIFDFQFL